MEYFLEKHSIGKRLEEHKGYLVEFYTQCILHKKATFALLEETIMISWDYKARTVFKKVSESVVAVSCEYFYTMSFLVASY
jgi:hypothetical protein